MNRYLLLEHSRLSSDVAHLQQQLVMHRPGIGLKARSVHSFLDLLCRHKQDMLKDLDLRMVEQERPLNTLN